ncbi:2-hydroxyacylsphingosine 1-beta-galactosyltransferase-like [Babylonia areolata]|uniref:2-hydroxyacylsphingosine 1-beta-galactosyltransferase-like n=1 Tax=Babylonia areolata TaxID=304850 RepID=UPI003FD43D80
MWPTAVVLACLLAVTSYVVQTSEAKRVVTIPFPFTSHSKYHTNVARALASRGHDVWVALPVYILEKQYLDTAGFSFFSYDTMPDLEHTLQSIMSDSYFQNKPENIFEFLRISKDIFDVLLRNESFIHTIEEKRPDLIVIDNIASFYAMSVIPYRLGIPFAFMGSVYYAPTCRIPFSTADAPLVILPYSNKMNFFQRLHNTLFFLLLALYNPSIPDDAVSTYAPKMKYLPLIELANKAEIFVVETDHVLDYPRSTLPNVKLIGGTATGPAKALPPEFQSFMDSAKEGVVIVSFGSYVLGLPKHISDKILQVLLQLPMKSVFRSNLTSPDPKKILTAPWIPQNDLLGHPHTKVFVSHCGKNGQYEALYHAVPIVATPLFIDQPYNAERARVKGFAEVLDLNTCTAEQMRSSILTVANEPRYKQAVVKRSRLFRELYGLPMETAAYWLDHVMEYGGDYMRSAGQQMPVYQYVLLDVFLFILAVLALVVVMVYCAIRALCRCFQKKKTKAE